MDAFVTELRRFILEHGHDMLIPADDTALTAIIERYDDFKGLVHIACPPPGVTRLVLNKAATLEIAQQCGIRVPRTVIVSNSGQLSEYVDRFPFPWVLKPVEKESRFERVDNKSHILSTASDVAQKFPAGREFSAPMLLQEFCSGVGVGIEILMHKGNCLAVFQHRRLKELPYTGGVAVTAVAEHPDPALVEPSLSLLRALHWEGVAMVEFKVNPNDGSAVLMEVNGRYWGTLSLPVSAGIDFPLYQWQLAHGEEPKIPKTYAAGTRWRWTVGCLDRMYRLFGGARYSAAPREVRLRELLHFPEDFSPLIRDATFAFVDPLPSMAALFHAIKFFIFPKNPVAAEELGPRLGAE
jgi:predicted ATP-grasp superfamily ATP-dependent carboligase